LCSDSIHTQNSRHSQMSDLHQLAVLDLASKDLEQGGLARAWRAQQQTHAPLRQTAPALLEILIHTASMNDSWFDSLCVTSHLLQELSGRFSDEHKDLICG